MKKLFAIVALGTLVLSAGAFAETSTENAAEATTTPIAKTDAAATESEATTAASTEQAAKSDAATVTTDAKSQDIASQPKAE